MLTSLHRRYISGAYAAAVVAGMLFLAAPAHAESVPAWAPIAVSGPTNLPPTQSEVQRVAVDAEGGTFTLSFGAATTAPLPFDVPAAGGVGPTASLQNALDALSTIEGVGAGVSVIGGPGNRGSEDPYLVTFGGSLANTNVGKLSADGSALNGGGNHVVQTATVTQGGPGTGKIAVYVQNVGGAASAGTVTVEDRLPPGLSISAAVTGEGWECPPLGPGRIVCTTTKSVASGTAAKPILIPVSVGAEPLGPEANLVTVSGGGAAALASYEEPVTISAAPTKPGAQAFTAGFYEADGAPSTQAGSHPYTASFALFVNTVRSPRGGVVPAGDAKTIAVVMPPGVFANPEASPGCAEGIKASECPLETQVGIAQSIAGAFGATAELSALHSIHAPNDYPAKLLFSPVGLISINVVSGLRSDEGYGAAIEIPNAPQANTIFGAFVSLWGVPADSDHDELRCETLVPHAGCGPGAANHTAFLTQATDCGLQAATAPAVRLSLDTWQSAGDFAQRSFPVAPVRGCDQLGIHPGFAFAPDASRSDSPAAFAARLTAPAEGLAEPGQLAPAEIRKIAAKLPEGVVLNPGGASGLGSCSEQQIGLLNEIDPTAGLPRPLPAPSPIRFSAAPNRCPEDSKIGTGELKTALLEDPLKGNLYLAAQGKGNPFGSLFAVYLAIEDPSRGVFVKLPGEIDADRRTGQLEVILDNLPQLPFTSLTLDLKGGSHSPLATPSTCGEFVTAATSTPWSAPESGPPAVTESRFTLAAGPGGGTCADTPQARPFDLGLKAGDISTMAGAPSPFVARITRPDGAQELDSLEISPPPGLVASLKGIPYCTEARIEAAEGGSGIAEQATPTCPASSQVGTAEAGVGSGPSPFYAAGDMYLAGPYKGAPLSLVAIVPGVAGPFDLGNLVIRSALYVDPTSARLTARTDPIPRFLDGVALRIRDLRIRLDRQGWALNPTSCEARTVDVTAHGDSGAVSHLSNRFQVGGCAALAFKPKLRLGLAGAPGRNGHPALTATLTQAPGQANVGSLSLALPRSELLAQEHIRAVCTRARFAEHACPARSIYGHVEAETPLTDQPLSGPVYLRASDHKLPDLVLALRGPAAQPIEIDLAGRVDSVNGRIRIAFEALPDAPVSRLVLKMQGGSKGLLANSRDLCARPSRATVRLVGQNNKRADQFPMVRSRCGKRSS